MISIIVPVYNAERFLKKSVDSVLSQTYKDWELILVDDGSHDNSGRICDEYARKDERIRTFHNQNGGPSVARNYGIKMSKGEHICFIDADDWVEKTYLEHLYNGLHTGVGVVIGGHYFDNREHPEKSKVRKVGQHFYAVPDMHHIFLDRDLPNWGYPHGKLYNGNLVRTQGIEFPPEIKYCEDLIFLLRYLDYVDWVSYIPEIDYHYTYSNIEVSLIQRFHSSETEYKGYSLCRSNFEHLAEKYGVSHEEMIPAYNCYTYMLWRSVRTLYVDGERKVSRKEGIRFLKTLTKTDCRLLTKYTYWIMWKNIPPLYLIRFHCYYIADFWFMNVARLGKRLKG